MFIKKLVRAFRVEAIRGRHRLNVLCLAVSTIVFACAFAAQILSQHHRQDLAVIAFICLVVLLLALSDTIGRVLWQYDEYRLSQAMARQAEDFEARLASDPFLSEEQKQMTRQDFYCGDRLPLDEYLQP